MNEIVGLIVPAQSSAHASEHFEISPLEQPCTIVTTNMAPSQLQHRRTHNLLLINKLLGQRDAGSPCTLVLDSLEQSARPLIKEYLRRAKVRTLIVSRSETIG